MFRLEGRCVSIVTIGERQLQSNENSHVRKKVSCPIADIGELSGHSTYRKAIVYSFAILIFPNHHPT
jgi:hypothetical protein